jgi:hypothetical protein
MLSMKSYSFGKARARLGALLREPVDALARQETRALTAYRELQARGEDAGVPHGEAYDRVFVHHSDGAGPE